jgi:hypothetical protein
MRMRTLGSVHDYLEKDPEIVEAALSQVGDALYYAHENLGIVENAVSRDDPVSIIANEDHKKDCEVVKAAVDQKGMVLRSAHDDYKEDLGISACLSQRRTWRLSRSR